MYFEVDNITESIPLLSGWVVSDIDMVTAFLIIPVFIAALFVVALNM